MKNPSKELAGEIEKFLSQTGMPPTAFGWATVLDPRFVRDVREGRELRQRTRQKVSRYIRFARQQWTK